MSILLNQQISRDNLGGKEIPSQNLPRRFDVSPEPKTRTSFPAHSAAPLLGVQTKDARL